MNDIYIFKRVEKKYLITLEKKEALLKEIRHRLIPDSHGNSTISGLYLDTPDFLLIRNSIDAISYKEKLRLRSYGEAGLDSKIFLEIKKKFKGVVYKRRVSLPLSAAYEYIESQTRPEESQIMNEIDYAMKFYRHPKPKMAIFYEREAYFASGLPTLRITFDSNLRYREDDLRLENGSHGAPILEENQLILEIKTDGAMPLWLSAALDKFEIYPRSFSKYGTAYKTTIGELPKICNDCIKGEEKNVCTV